MCPYHSLLKKLCQLQLQVKFDTICHLIILYIIYVIRTFTIANTLQVIAQDLSIQVPTFSCSWNQSHKNLKSCICQYKTFPNAMAKINWEQLVNKLPSPFYFSAIPTSRYLLYALFSMVSTLRILILRVKDQLHTFQQHPLHFSMQRCSLKVCFSHQ